MASAARLAWMKDALRADGNGRWHESPGSVDGLAGGRGSGFESRHVVVQGSSSLFCKYDSFFHSESLMSSVSLSQSCSEARWSLTYHILVFLMIIRVAVIFNLLSPYPGTEQSRTRHPLPPPLPRLSLYVNHKQPSAARYPLAIQRPGRK